MELSFRDPLECYQQIGSLVANAIPESWVDVEISCELSGLEVALVKTYMPRVGLVRRDVPFIPTLGECFYRLARLVSTEEKGFFRKCAFRMAGDGKFDVKFEY